MSQTEDLPRSTMETRMLKDRKPPKLLRKEPERRLGPASYTFSSRRRRKDALKYLGLLDNAPADAEDVIREAALIDAWLAGDLEVGLMRSTPADGADTGNSIALCFDLESEEEDSAAWRAVRWTFNIMQAIGFLCSLYVIADLIWRHS